MFTRTKQRYASVLSLNKCLNRRTTLLFIFPQDIRPVISNSVHSCCLTDCIRKGSPILCRCLRWCLPKKVVMEIPRPNKNFTCRYQTYIEPLCDLDAVTLLVLDTHFCECHLVNQIVISFIEQEKSTQLHQACNVL